MKRLWEGHAFAWPFALRMRQMAALAALCLLSSGEWLLDGALPESAGAGRGLRLLMVGLVGLLVSSLRRETGRHRSLTHTASLAAASVALIGIPYLLLVSVVGRVASTTVVLVFGGMPVLFAVTAGLSLRELPAGLLGLAGLMVVLPLQMPQGSGAALGVALVVFAMALTAVSMAWMSRLLRGFPLFTAVGLAGTCNGLLLVLAAVISALPHIDFATLAKEGLRCVLSDLPQTILLIWLLKEIAPQRLASRYVVAPMLTVMEGLLLLRPGLDLRTLLGLALLGAGAYGMLRLKPTDDGEVLRLT